MSETKKFRTDIQALRGYAVLLVMLDHFGVPGFAQGFLGVDIFFVISGFLISGLIVEQLDQNRFSFMNFYFRRAKRLLPAAYATILMTSIFGIWFLNSSELAGLFLQIVGAVTFSINFVLLNQSGYFDLASASKPLLHLWSLAVEEQFYLVFPVLLVCVPKRNRMRLWSALFILSLAVCLYSLNHKPSAAFYLLPSRAWELLLGALGTLLTLSPKQASLIRRSEWLAVLTVLAIPIFPTKLPHPGVDAFLVSLATLLLLVNQPARWSRSQLLGPLVKLGDWSYSVYLVHWPILVLMSAAFVDAVPAKAHALAFFLSIGLGATMSILIERPFRKVPHFNQRFLSATILAAALLVGVQVAIDSYEDSKFDFLTERRPNYGLNQACDSLEFADRALCRSSARPTTLLWGDSYGMHVALGIAANRSEGILQATASSCPPFTIGTAACDSFNWNVMQYLRTHSEISTIVLAADFRKYFADSNATAMVLAERRKALLQTVSAVQALGRTVVVVKPPANVGERNVRCAERKLMHKFVFGDNLSCNLSLAQHLVNEEAPQRILTELVEQFKIRTLDLASAACDSLECRSTLDGVLLYRDDGGHLTVAGEDVLFKKLGPKIAEAFASQN